jgi:hypothetical protein
MNAITNRPIFIEDSFQTRLLPSVRSEIAHYAFGLRLRAVVMVLNALVAAYFAYGISGAASEVASTAEFPAVMEQADLISSCIWVSAAFGAVSVFCLFEARRSWKKACNVMRSDTNLIRSVIL